VFENSFGIEIEFTGVTRSEAARAAAEFLGGTVASAGDHYDTKKVTAPDGRVWKFMSDSSIRAQKKVDGKLADADDTYKVELVSPILTYREDIDTLQKLVRRLRKAGGFSNSSTGIHIHLDSSKHTPRSVRNFVNIIASKNDLLYKALQIEPDRMRYCKKIDAFLVERINQKKPKTMSEIADVWYEKYNENRNTKYHSSRYSFINLHSLFTGNHTIELRGFNSVIEHCGKIRAFIVLALAINHQALTQRSASPRKSQDANEKFALRTFLNRIGFIGPEFKNCREHLCKHLSGSAAWRFRTGG
jgi:hypothetical protein